MHAIFANVGSRVKRFSNQFALPGAFIRNFVLSIGVSLIVL